MPLKKQKRVQAKVLAKRAAQVEHKSNNIHESLSALAVDMDTLKKDPRNAREHDAYNLDIIKKSLAKFAQRKPIIVQKSTSIIRAGNGTFTAAKEMGWDKIAAIFVDDDDQLATEYAIVDNRSAELSSWDSGQLESLLKELETSNIDLIDLGFAHYNIEDVDAFEEWDAMPEFTNDNDEAHQEFLGGSTVLPWRTIRVHFASQDELDKFIEKLGLKYITEKSRFFWYPERRRRDLTEMGFVSPDLEGKELPQIRKHPRKDKNAKRKARTK